jgi:hypothetical protein
MLTLHHSLTDLLELIPAKIDSIPLLPYDKRILTDIINGHIPKTWDKITRRLKKITDGSKDQTKKHDLTKPTKNVLEYFKERHINADVVNMVTEFMKPTRYYDMCLIQGYL